MVARTADTGGATGARSLEGLTKAERAIVAVWANPEYLQADDAECAMAAGVSERTYYRAKAKPELRRLAASLALELIEAEIRPVVSALVRTAKMPGREGHQDRKLLFEMKNIYRQQIEQHLTVRGADVPPPATTLEKWLERSREIDHLATAGGSATEGD